MFNCLSVKTETGSSRDGFTLIELSIVLVIIGLLVGGVLVGQDLIRTAQRRSVVTDLEKLGTAVSTFRGKYRCLPGDCSNITTFLAGSALANGNGDNQIGFFPNDTYVNETFQFYYQLGLTGLIRGNYTGVSTSGNGRTNGYTVGANILPATFDSTIGYTVVFFPAVADNANDYTPPIRPSYYSHVIMVGKPAATPPQTNLYESYGPSLTPSDAYYIDGKIDDGMPASGTVTHFLPVAFANCTTTATTAANYNITYKSPACGLNVYNRF